MAYNNATGTYTTASGSTTAAPGQTIASATWNGIFTDIASNMRPAGNLILTQTAVNFNATGDTAFAMSLPPGYVNYVIKNLYISNASASLSSSKVGLFTAASGAGYAIVAASTAVTVTATAISVSGNSMNFTINNQFTQAVNSSSLYFHVSTAQGSAATGTVTLEYAPIS